MGDRPLKKSKSRMQTPCPPTAVAFLWPGKWLEGSSRFCPHCVFCRKTSSTQVIGFFGTWEQVGVQVRCTTMRGACLNGLRVC